MKDCKLVFQIPVFLFKDSLTVMLTDLQKKLSNLKSDIENHWETPTIQMKGIAITDNFGLIKQKSEVDTTKPLGILLLSVLWTFF